jgi:hypothetical protein
MVKSDLQLSRQGLCFVHFIRRLRFIDNGHPDVLNQLSKVCVVVASKRS